MEMLAGVRIHSPSIAAAAARINASIQAKKGIQHVDVPPIRSVSPRPQRIRTITADTSVPGCKPNRENSIPWRIWFQH